MGLDRQPAEDLPGVDRFLLADISDVAAAGRAFAEMRVAEGRLDALVNNAAIQLAKPFLETSLDEWEAVMGSNLRSVYLAVSAAHPLLKAQGGAIVNVSSVHAVATSANIACYAASKGALLALTRALAIEFAPDRIRVNAVLPGAVDTPMLRAGLARGPMAAADPERQMAELARRTVMGRVGRPDEIAQTILFLADEARSSYMTGQAVIVDGGATCRLSTE